MITIYTDGSCKNKRGGWAALVTGPAERMTLSGKAVDTTSNRMEILAAISALESLPVGSEATIHSDSEYLVKTMTRGWRRNVNLDLWQRLDAVAGEHTIVWEWVKAHDGNPGNEFVNALAEFEAGVRDERPRLERYLPADDAAPEPQASPDSPAPHPPGRAGPRKHGGRGREAGVDAGGRGPRLRLDAARHSRAHSQRAASRRATCSAWRASQASWRPSAPPTSSRSAIRCRSTRCAWSSTWTRPTAAW